MAGLSVFTAQLVLVLLAGAAGALVGDLVAGILFNGVVNLLAINILTLVFMAVGAIVGILLVPVFIWIGGKF